MAKVVRADVAQQPLFISVDAIETLPSLDEVTPSSPVPCGPVHIDRLIVHGLDHRSGNLDLVDEAAVLSDDAEHFFASHIEFASSHWEWQAKFRNETSQVPSLCKRLLGTPENFVGASRELARLLFQEMRTRVIVPGDFVVVVYRQSEVATRHVGLLKLDPDKRHIRTFDTIGGKRRVNISIAKNILPESRSLQKCALLTPEKSMVVTLLDRQIGPRSEGIAAFFHSGFLTTDLVPNSRRHTREFLHRSETWVNEQSNRLSLTPDEIEVFWKVRREALSADELDLDTFAKAALPSQPELQDDLRTLLSNTIASTPREVTHITRFKVDHQVAQPVIQRMTLELDGGAKLIVPADRYEELVHIEPVRTLENKYRIVIESQTLKEVSER